MLEFESRFRSEDACREYLADLRWPSGFICDKCFHRRAWRNNRSLWVCGKCRFEHSVTAGTIFHGSHIPLRLWFRAMWQVTNQKSGISALSLQRSLGIRSYRTAWACLHKLRAAMVRPGREQLSGEVEVDEIYIGGHEKGKGGRHIGKKSLVIVAAEVREKGTGRIRMKRIESASEKNLIGFVQEVVCPGSKVVTDGLPVYRQLAELGYLHESRIPESRDQSSATLPRVHRVAALVKRWLLGTHQGSFSKKLLAGYLDEFTFRFNRRLAATRGMVFYRLAQQAIVTAPTDNRFNGVKPVPV
jgi:transposase-like protein